MGRPAKVVADEVASCARGIDIYIRRMERLFGGGHLSEADLLRSYAGGFLSFHSKVENSLERLFVGVLMKRFRQMIGWSVR
jgi:hypothetical protein